MLIFDFWNDPSLFSHHIGFVFVVSIGLQSLCYVRDTALFHSLIFMITCPFYD